MDTWLESERYYRTKIKEVFFFYFFRILGLSMTKPIRNPGPCFHLSLPHQRDVLSHTEFINVHILLALSLPDHPLRVTKKATHGKRVGPTLSTPRGDKYNNQYSPLCEVCPRDRGKVVGTLQGITPWWTPIVSIALYRKLPRFGKPLELVRSSFFAFNGIT